VCRRWQARWGPRGSVGGWDDGAQPASAQFIDGDQDNVKRAAVLKPDHPRRAEGDRAKRAVELDAVGQVAAGLAILIEGLAGIFAYGVRGCALRCEEPGHGCASGSWRIVAAT